MKLYYICFHELDVVCFVIKVESLDQQLCDVRKVAESKSSQMGDLEKSVVESQEMLQQSNSRVSELEEVQGRLELQVSIIVINTKYFTLVVTLLI